MHSLLKDTRHPIGEKRQKILTGFHPQKKEGIFVKKILYNYSNLLKISVMLLIITLWLSCNGGSSGGNGAENYRPRPATGLSLNVNVVDETGAPVSGFRWLIEEDTTYPVTPGVPVTDSLSVNIHRSYSPVLQNGAAPGSSATINNMPYGTRTFLSVLPNDYGYSMGAAGIQPGQPDVTIVVHRPPQPTAQISIYVFEDNAPLNGAPDIPAERPLSGFSVVIFDIFGQQMQDVFGNMLGTTYMQNPDGSYVLDGDGNPVVAMHGSGIITTNANGEAFVKNLAQGKYGVIVSPPPGETWVQTATIEGTPTNDSWVAHNEPPYFLEWGLSSWHVFYGFIHPTTLPPTTPSGTITGQAVYVHDNKPPLMPGLNSGMPVPEAWVALNNLSGADEVVYAQPCDENGFFTINNVPPGTYQLVVFDYPLDAIIDFRTVDVPATGGLIALDKVAVFCWFGHLEGNVFNDMNMNGIMDTGEMGIPGQAVNIRYSDGSIYKITTTNNTGDYEFVETFPFFHWLVAEVDFTRLKATGATVMVDDGGPVMPGENMNPQLQPENGNLPYRTQTGEVLLQAMLLFAGQTNMVHWGKSAYPDGENGPITGIVHYATTRAENDPRYAVAEDWEPGIPRVQVNLYQDSDLNGVIDDLDWDGIPTPADVDNYPFGWSTGSARGEEDMDRNGNGVFDPGDAVQIVNTDSWDDNNPTGAVGPAQNVHGQPIKNGAETIRTWNQLRPGVFDGGYEFNSYFPGGMAAGGPEVDGLPSGYYIVEANMPPGYELVKEEDKNVDFGETYVPAIIPVLGPPICLGDPHLVPDELSLFPGVPCYYAKQTRPLCDRKLVLVSHGKNPAADFFFFTEVPKAARVWGMVLSDVALEYDPNSPNYGNNLGPSWLPIAIKDWTGREITRVYTDEWGRYNALVPSTYSVNIPAPSGVSPNILNACINDPGPIPDPNNPGNMIPDPWYNPTYGTICSQWHFLPGRTTELDTPILPIGAFAMNKTPLDCEFPDGTPVISSVSSPDGGPYVSRTITELTISSLGAVSVANPDYDPSIPGSQPTIIRDYGFGNISGTVKIGNIPLMPLTWSNSTVTGIVPNGALTGQLSITRGDNGNSSLMGVTLHVQSPNIPQVIIVNPGQSIQAAIDSAVDNALIVVKPGVYKENPIISKPVKLQGSGAYSTIIQAGPLSPEEQAAWDAKLFSLTSSGAVEAIPGNRPNLLAETPGIGVGFSHSTVVNSQNPPLIDGFKIYGSTGGGAIFANAYAHYLHISNNKLSNNQSNYGGGIRIGTSTIINDASDGYNGSFNDHVNIHHNQIIANGATEGAGGISLFNGADNYIVANNFICGNFTLLYGGGIAHFGLCNNGLITGNRIKSNQSFDEGGGIMIAGELVPAGAPVGTLTPGTGSVMVNGNQIVGNLAGDDGGGIRTLMVNGQDVQLNWQYPDWWHRIDIINNFIANNVSWDAGGGISLDDTARAFIINNTIAHNDATSTGVDAFGPCVPNVPPGNFCTGVGGGGGGLTNSVPQVGGIMSRAHSIGLQAAFGPGVEQEYPDPVLEDNIIRLNRSFYWDAAYNGGLGGMRPDIANSEAPVYWDLAVAGTAAIQVLHPMNSVLSSLVITFPDHTESYDPSNIASDPLFIDGSYFNSFLATSKGAAFGNFVIATFKLPGSHGNYHINAGSPAINLGLGFYLPQYPLLNWDIDGETRPNGLGVDAGADERH